MARSVLVALALCFVPAHLGLGETLQILRRRLLPRRLTIGAFKGMGGQDGPRPGRRKRLSEP